MHEAMKFFFRFHLKMKDFGYSHSMDDHERRKLNIFNLMNFFGLGVGMSMAAIVWSKGYFVPAFAWWACCIPPLISFTALILNYFQYRSYQRIWLQNRGLAEKAVLLEQQTIQLTELNYLKNKLFSVIAHDLKGPVFALNTLFKNMVRYDLPGDEIKAFLPEVVQDIGSTTNQIENLLHWVNCQMNEGDVELQLLDISNIVREVLQFLHLQVLAKRIHLEIRMERPAYIIGDKEMVNLVLRNLISNAIKFTPHEGTITLDAREGKSHVEVFVEDTGAGISPDMLQQLIDGIHSTTPGTANEQGTGLGLALCKEFLSRNGGRLNIHSEPGKGSIFSFTLPKNTA
jgi:two-component system, sensor histidine kinase and response regulator